MMTRKLLFVTALLLACYATGCVVEEDVGADESFSVAAHSWDVWEPVHAWSDTAPNGETYEEYYSTWLIENITHIDGKQVHYLLADGEKVPAPSLECSDTAIFVRTMFAQQHGLPMIVYGGKEVFGHFGWYKSSGYRAKSYRQYKLDAPRGSDSTLQSINRYLPDDLQTFPLSGMGGMGEYMDAAFRNKRFGVFMQDMLLMYFSGNVAENGNTYYIKPEYVRGGDVQLHRSHPWKYIGHTITIQEVRRLGDSLQKINFIQSYMPTHPWISDGYSELTTYAGKPENHSGLRRWRIPTMSNGRWYNSKDSSVALAESLVPTVKDRFKELFDIDYEEQVASMVATINGSRDAQYENPNSCRRREDREKAFNILYDLYQTTKELYEPLGFTSQPTLEQIRPAVDRQHRTINDFIWAEMVYEGSWVCHWNPADKEVNKSMYDAVVAYNQQVALVDGCEGLRMFRNKDVNDYDGGDGLDDLATWARANGYQWDDYYLDPSEGDEGGALRNVVTDQLADPNAIEYFCSIYEDLEYYSMN